MPHDSRNETPEQYAAYTGKMSYPAGVAKIEAEAALARPVLAFQASDTDYINAFIRDLEDPDKRLVTEKLHDWRNYGVAGKSAILFALRTFVAMQRAKEKA